MHDSERILWLFVVVQALEDIAHGRDREWLGSPDFVLVCDLAEISPEAVLLARGASPMRAVEARAKLYLERRQRKRAA